MQFDIDGVLIRKNGEDALQKFIAHSISTEVIIFCTVLYSSVEMLPETKVTRRCICHSRLEEQPRPFLLHPCLKDSAEELRFLKACSQILVYCLLPSKDVQSVSLRVILSEILASKGNWVTEIICRYYEIICRKKSNWVRGIFFKWMLFFYLARSNCPTHPISEF